MSTVIETSMLDHSVVEFYGGARRGPCLQITSLKPVQVRDTLLEQLQDEGFIHLTLDEATILRDVLTMWIEKQGGQQ